ncbi:MAG: hypothetical protein JWM21_3437 [Acidobacteria bacterium]|nr:hypothetical protein [Acidobacteriota bacterium]
MTTLQLILWSSAYLIEFGIVIYFTRATARRVMGALAGGAAAGLWGMGAIALCRDLGWWQIPFASKIFLLLFYLGVSISVTPIYLVTWRLARRFGWRGLAIFTGIVTIIGPPRDYFIAATFPKWMVFAPGLAPIIADGVTYAGIVIVGHAVMRLVAGPASEDGFARSNTVSRADRR